MTDETHVRNTAILPENELMAATGYTRRKDLMMCLIKQRIPYFLGKGGRIWTTTGALNGCLLPRQANVNSDRGLE